jgi:hypothetical protein
MDQKLLFAGICALFKCLQENRQKRVCAVRLVAIQVTKDRKTDDALTFKSGGESTNSYNRNNAPGLE